VGIDILTGLSILLIIGGVIFYASLVFGFTSFSLFGLLMAAISFIAIMIILVKERIEERRGDDDFNKY